MAICAFKVGTAGLSLRRNVPTTASLVGNKGEIVVGGNALDKERVMMDRMQAIGGTERRSLQGGEGAG